MQQIIRCEENKYIKKFTSKILKLENYDYNEQLTEEELDDEEKSNDMPPLESNSKQFINQTSNVISANKNWKQFIQIKK